MYPIGFGYRGFVYLPALSRFENLKLNFPTSALAPPALSTSTDTFACSPTSTDAYTEEELHSTVTITQTTTYTTTAFFITSTSAKAIAADMIHGRG